jgi:predicted metal-dependent peptidase
MSSVAGQQQPRPKLCHLPDDIMERASVVMILDRGHVFYANMLLQMDKERTSMSRDTLGAAVYVKNGRICLMYDKEIWEEHGLTIDDVIYILKHEIGHCLLEHFGRRRGRDPFRWNVCGDFAVNCIIGKPGKLPVLWPSDPKFGLPENLSAEEYDKLLPKQDGDNGSGGGYIIVQGKNGQSKTTGSKHDPNQEIQEGTAQELEREVVRQAVDKAYKSCKDKGNLPGNLEQLIDKILKRNRIDWKRALRSIIGTAAKVGHRLSWKKESRRFGSTAKGQLKRRSLEVAAVVDTSGSMSDEEVSAILTEIQGIQKSYRGCVIHVVECDMEVGKYYKLHSYGKIQTKVTGRGGTSFKPPFKYLEQKKIRPDVLVYLTDLEGDFPEKKPPYPVIWTATTDHSVPWGWVIRLPKGFEKED